MTFKENAKIALSKVLSDVIQSDGIVNQGEILYLGSVFKSLKINNGHLKKSVNISLGEAASILRGCGPDEKQAIRAAVEQISASDGDINSNETLLITALLIAIGVDHPGIPALKAEIISIPRPDFDTRDNVIYVESFFNSRVNQAILSQYEELGRLLEQRGKALFYLPKFMNTLQGKSKMLKQTLRYLEPLLSDEQMRRIDRDMGRIDTAMLSQEIFLNYLGSRGFNLEHPAFLFKIDNQKTSRHQDYLLLYIDGASPLATLQRFYAINDLLMQRPNGEAVSDELQYTGLHKIVIDTILKYHSDEGLSRLLISEDGHIFLLDRNRTEVRIQALGRALYILYLRHREGIALSELCDYRDELLDIYARISKYNDMRKLESSIDNMVNFVGNTLNPLLSRIKSAFASLLGEQAKDYLIEGDKGDRKNIFLDRRLVIDELG